MPRKRIASLLLVSVFAGLATISMAAPPVFQRSLFGTAEQVKWHDNLQTAYRQAVAQNKPILIVFGAEWCGFCTKLEKQTLKSPEVARYISETFVPVHLDLDKEKRIGEILEVTSLPCTIVVSPTADLLGRIDGFQGPVPFQEKLIAARQLYQSIQPASDSVPVLR